MTLYQPNFAHPFRIEAAARSEWGHHFGGPIEHALLSDDRVEPHLHLLYMLNTDDPILSEVRIPGAKWLPLYYPFRYDSGDLSYQVLSDREVRILNSFDSDPEPPGHPFEGFPDSFPRVPVRLEPIPYEIHRLIGFAAAARNTGLLDQPLSPADKLTLKRLDWPFTFAQVGGIHWLIQGETYDSCWNPDCVKRGGPMLLFAVIWNRPVPQTNLWSSYGDFTQIIYSICPECLSLSACNRCD